MAPLSRSLPDALERPLCRDGGSSKSRSEVRGRALLTAERTAGGGSCRGWAPTDRRRSPRRMHVQLSGTFSLPFPTFALPRPRVATPNRVVLRFIGSTVMDLPCRALEQPVARKQRRCAGLAWRGQCQCLGLRPPLGPEQPNTHLEIDHRLAIDGQASLTGRITADHPKCHFGQRRR